jgi:hypothetical protein
VPFVQKLTNTPSLPVMTPGGSRERPNDWQIVHDAQILIKADLRHSRYDTLERNSPSS